MLITFLDHCVGSNTENFETTGTDFFSAVVISYTVFHFTEFFLQLVMLHNEMGLPNSLFS